MNYFDKKRKYLINSKKTDEYIKDGLQLWIDGIENTREGHSSNALLNLKDLSGNNYDFSIAYGNTITPENNCLPFNSSIYVCSNEYLKELLSELKERTIEIVCEIDDSNTTAKTILMGAKSGGASFGVGMWYRPASKGMCISSVTSNASIISDITKPHTYSAVYDAVSYNNTKFYQNNVLCSKTTGGNMANSNFVTIGGRYYSDNYTNYRFYGKIYCIRVYDRQLTQEEREHNRRIDKERFGI